MADSSNPYLVFRQLLFDLMYPPIALGYVERMDFLIGLLAITIALAAFYTLLAMRKMRRDGKEVWLFRLVTRPQGVYFACNQYFVYPLEVTICCVLWLAYISQALSWWVRHASADRSFYWITMVTTIPAFFVMFTTTVAVLSGANLASSRRGALSHHVLPPKAANAFFCLLPVLLLAMFVTSARAGGAFAYVFELWDAMQQKALEQAGTYEGVPTAMDVTVLGNTQILEVLHVPYEQFLEFQRVSIITDITCFVILLFFNLGGIALVTAHRVTNKTQLVFSRAPIVAPLGPLATSNASDTALEHIVSIADTTKSSFSVAKDWYEDPDAQRDGGSPETSRGHRLEWDITLFYFGVAPVTLVYLGYSAWILASPEPAFGNTKTLEFASLAIPWAYTGLAALSLLAIVLKRVVVDFRRKSSSHSPHLPTVDEIRMSRSGSRRSSRVGVREGVDD